MIVTLAFSSEFFADEMFRSLIEGFFRSEITHTEVAAALNQQPEQISAILGAIFIVGVKSTNPLTRLNIFPELSSATPLDVEKAHLIAAGLPEDIADSILFIINEGALPALRCEMESTGGWMRINFLCEKPFFCSFPYLSPYYTPITPYFPPGSETGIKQG